ncbi:MAG: metallophosphatase, partial [Prevotellaceae bacterium]|nr:metallophosphatase [Prevotellaceae bacterium]
MSKKLFYIVALALLLAGCQARETEVVILSLNDLHAKIDNLDKVAAFVEKERAENPNVLLLAAGDLFSGNPVVDYYPDKGFPMIDLMNEIKFDAVTLGNHEFDYGQNALANRMAQANFPFLCANICADSSKIPAPKPYLFFTKTGEKVCVVGLGQERPEALTESLKNLTFHNPIEELSKYTWLRKKSNLLIALTHLGVEQDSLLALRYGALDLIVGGHSHTKLDTGMLVN